MNDSTLLFAPHQNSYERLVPDKHAPTAICWGYENRTAAIRIPAGSRRRGGSNIGWPAAT
jgi:glutamine synthetase